MSIRILITSILVYGLVGCATPQSVRSGPAADSFVSAKSAAAVFECIANAWEALGHAGEMQSRPTLTGYTLSITRITNTLIVVDVLNSKTGSTSNLYWGAVLGGGELKEAIQKCQ